MKVLHAVASLHASYGGPARSVPALAGGLQKQGCDTVLWAADGTGAGDGSPQGFDLVHDHGIWLPYNWRLSRAAGRCHVPRVVSPRGMLEPWAMQHKRWKKRLAWWLYQRRALSSAVCLHATADSEAESISRLRLNVPVCVIPNGVHAPAELPVRSWDVGTGNQTALFLSRIHPKKGLPLLVEAWRQIRPHGWKLEIAGPDEAGHRAGVELLVQKAGLSGEITFLGPLEGEAKLQAFSRAGLFILPTYSENFGMAVAEALAHGVPVITTTGTPWEVLQTADCGWWVEPSVHGIAGALKQATDLEVSVRERMGRNGYQLVTSRFTWEAAAQNMVAVYSWLLGRGPRPTCVRA